MSKIKIQGNASGTGVVTLTAPNTNTDRTITLPDGDISLGVGIDDNATSTAITIDASENVGIGTTTPDGKLHIDGTSTTVTGLVLEAGMNGDCRSVDFHNSDGNKRVGIVYDNTNIKLNITDRSENKLVTIGELTGDVTVGTGNLVIGTSGKGIDFSADGNAAGMTSEVLDDYETGTWTCTLRGGTTEPATLITASIAKYTKIGNVVTFQVSFENVSTIGYSGGINFGTLPFANNGGRAVTSMGLYRMATWSDAPTGMISNGANTISAMDHKSGTTWAYCTHQPLGASYIWITGTYRTDS